MKEVKIYTIVSDQLSPPITGESFCTDMVLIVIMRNLRLNTRC